MKEPKFIPGYENENLDVAFARGEVDAQVASTSTVVEHDLVNKRLVDFHAAIEAPKGRKDSRFANLNLPDIEEFAKADKEKKLLNMMRGSDLSARLCSCRRRLRKIVSTSSKRPCEKPIQNQRSSTSIGNSPAAMNRLRFIPDEQAKVVKEIPRDAETIELFLAGTGPLPPR